MSAKVLKDLGIKIRSLRKAKGWSQEKLAERCGRHWTYIGGLERGERNATVNVLSEIARALDVPIHELFCHGAAK